MTTLGIFDTGIFDTGIFDHSAEVVTARAPSYGHWSRTRDRNKPVAPTLPPPLEAGEVVIDEVVLLQMEEERLARELATKKKEALERVEGTRAIVRDRFDGVVASAAVRTRVIDLFRPERPAPLKEPVRGSITLRALGPRHLPKPEIAKSKTIMLRTASSRTSNETRR